MTDTKAEHTPGPWTVQRHDERHTFDLESHTAIKMPGSAEAVLYSLGADADEISANARLIAAAPELFAACEADHKAMDWLLARVAELDPTFMPSKSPVWPAVTQNRAAIRKATR